MKLYVSFFAGFVFLLFVFATPYSVTAGTQDAAKIAGHLQPHHSRYACSTWAPNLPCNGGEENHVVTGSLYIAYDLYLLVQDADRTAGIEGASFGILYDGMYLSGVEVFSWNLCADLEFTMLGWPGAGTGNTLTWNACQNAPASGDLEGHGYAVLGFFYLYAYSSDTFEVTQHPNSGEFAVADCDAATTHLAWPDHAAAIGFGTAGYDPCASQATCEVSPPNLDFGIVPINDFKDTTFVMTNIGAGTLAGTVSETCDQYEIISSASYSLAPGQSDTFTVRYLPATTGTHPCDIETGSTCNPIACVGSGGTACTGDTVVYVDVGATGVGDGSSWTDAFPQLYHAVAAALHCPEITQIWVAAGTYLPTPGTDRTATFQLRSGLAIYGGFAGGETSLSERNWAANTTILSGDIGASGTDTDNSYHVVVGSGTDSTAVLDGFTITKGYASGVDMDRWGGGMYNSYGHPTLVNVTFLDNYAYRTGGGMGNVYSNPTLRNVVFNGNATTLWESGGGGMANGYSNPTLVNVTFSNNDAGDGHGGGMHGYMSDAVVINTIFWGNTSALGEPEINNNTSYPVVSYSLVKGGLTSGCVDGGGNVFTDPLFVNGPGGDLRLSGRTSPAFNAGSNAAPDLPTADLDANPRVAADTVDMGAYELPVGVASAFPSPCVFAQAPGYETTCDTLRLVNEGGAACTIFQISGCGTVPFSMDTTMTAHVLAPGDTTEIVVCVTPSSPGPDSAQVTVASDAWNDPVTIPVILGSVTAVPEDGTPKPFRVVSVRPNPFARATAVNFTLPERMAVTAGVWSVTGRRVRVLARNRYFNSGENTVVWDGRTDLGTAAAAGLYFMRIETKLGAKPARLVLLK